MADRLGRRSLQELEIGEGGEAVVYTGEGGADAGGGVAFGEPVGEFGAEAGLQFDQGVDGAGGFAFGD